MIDFSKETRATILSNIKKYKHILGISSIITLAVLSVMLFVGKAQQAHAGDEPVLAIAAPAASSASVAQSATGATNTVDSNGNALKDSQAPSSSSAPITSSLINNAHMMVPILLNDGIPVTVERNIPVDSNGGISKNTEVTLTTAQADFVKRFGAYLASRHEFAIVTSGERSQEGQLDIIKERIEEKGVANKFPQLDQATVADSKIWFKAWNWLRGKRVPVNAPAEVPGQSVRVSQHLRGMAIDFIAPNFNQLMSWLNDFEKTPSGKEADLKIVGFVHEPGCIHINLAEQA